MFSLAFVQSLSHAQLFVIPWTAGHQAFLSFTISWSLLKLMSIQSVMPSNHLILCRPLYLCLQSFLDSGSFPISQLFASGGQSIGASASVLPMNFQDLLLLGLTVWISLQSKGLSRVLRMETPFLSDLSPCFPSPLSNLRIRLQWEILSPCPQNLLL